MSLPNRGSLQFQNMTHRDDAHLQPVGGRRDRLALGDDAAAVGQQHRFARLDPFHGRGVPAFGAVDDDRLTGGCPGQTSGVEQEERCGHFGSVT